MRILLVDDEKVVAEVLKEMIDRHMRRQGKTVDVVVAYSCAQGRALLSEERFDLLILDGKLMDGSGPELYVEHGEQLREQGTRVVVHSGEDAGGLRQRYPQLSRDGIMIITKGSGSSLLLNALDG